jgi:hypothetical protein
VEFNVDIFDAPPPEMSPATETKVSSIDSLHRYAQYTGQYPKLGLFDDALEAEAEEPAGVNEDVEAKSAESEHTGYGSGYEVGDEEEEHPDQEMSIPDGCDVGDQGGLEDQGLLNEDTHHDFYEQPSYEQERLRSVVALDV